MINHTNLKPTEVKEGVIVCVCDYSGNTTGDTEQAIRRKWPIINEPFNHVISAYGADLLGAVQTVTADKGTAEDGGDIAMIIVANAFVLKPDGGVVTYDDEAIESTMEQVLGIAAVTNLPLYIPRMDGRALSAITFLQERDEFSSVCVYVYAE